jgi:hypothetical protein
MPRCRNCRSFGEPHPDGYADCHHDDGPAAFTRAATPACEHFAPAATNDNEDDA